MGKQEIFIPDGVQNNAIERTTHLCIVAHHDDAEILGYHGVLECFNREDRWFGAVIVTDGAGSAREGIYKNYTDEQMKLIRIKEQKKAAYIGEYGFLKLLKYSSARTKSQDAEVVKDLQDIILQARPEVIYTHNPADKHATHIGVVTKVIQALQNIPAEMRPKKVYGGEVWRDLDWVDDAKKVQLVVDDHLNLERALLGVFDSQITGGKRYDLATEGRRTANATYADSHSVDNNLRITNALDLMPVVNGEYTLSSYVEYLIDDFKASVLGNLQVK